MFRILLLSAMGLGALYMMHLLAQDYNKITRPKPPMLPIVKGRFIRDTSNYEKNKIGVHDKIEIRWNKILNADAFSCARSLICQLHAEEVLMKKNANKNVQEDESKILLNLIRSTWKDLPQSMKISFVLGKYGQSDKCFKEYPLCFYSGKTMVWFLKINNRYFT